MTDVQKGRLARRIDAVGRLMTKVLGVVMIGTFSTLFLISTCQAYKADRREFFQSLIGIIVICLLFAACIFAGNKVEKFIDEYKDVNI
jgi:hypothetical protein